MSGQQADEETTVSKQRVSDYGEVYTRIREVNAMLDLVKQETERIDSRFLEPACGTGNFLIEILRRKLSVVERRYIKNQIEYERYAVLAVSSIYGIELLADNVEKCRNRLYVFFSEKYRSTYPKTFSEDVEKTVDFLLRKNIIRGDALSLTTEKGEPIVFSEWSAVNGNMLKRRDFKYEHLIDSSPLDGPNLFSDLGEDAFIPDPVKEYPLVHFLRIVDED